MKSTSSGAADALLNKMFDDASLFPPANLELAESVTQYLSHRTSAVRSMVGRYVCPASRLQELEALAGLEPPIAITLILDRSLDRRPTGNFIIENVEVVAPVHDLEVDIESAVVRATRAPLEALPAYVEIPLTAENLSSGVRQLATLRRQGAQVAAKVRCGGLTSADVPSSLQLARFIRACVDYDVPFKATAGLHHPVRAHQAGAGFVMHGFLNVAGAAILGRARDFTLQELMDILETDNPAEFHLDEDGFRWRNAVLTPQDVIAGRTFFQSIGSCSLSEPVSDLRALGFLTLA